MGRREPTTRVTLRLSNRMLAAIDREQAAMYVADRAAFIEQGMGWFLNFRAQVMGGVPVLVPRELREFASRAASYPRAAAPPAPPEPRKKPRRAAAPGATPPAPTRPAGRPARSRRPAR